MKKSIYIFQHSLPILFLLLTTGLLAQGTIAGSINDDDGEPLIGASVFIKDSSTGTTADFDGNYSFSAPAGDHVVIASFVGYGSKSFNVSVKDGETTVLDIVLGTDNLALDEVVVTGTFSGRSQKESPISMTFLSGAQLQKLASNSQADILRTVPGITAEGGGGEVASNVFVRGMPSGGQYQFTPLQVDGMPVLSTFGLNSSAHDVYFRNDIGIRNLEFVRGGASTLFGAGSVAGIINYSSVIGSSEEKNRVQLEWAQGGRAKMDFLTSGPINETTFYAISGFYRYDNGPLETGLPTKGYQLRGNIRKLFNNGKSSVTLYTQYIDDNVQFYLPYPLANDQGQKERPEGNDGETIYTLLTGAATDFSFDTPNGRFETPIGNGVTTKGGLVMIDLKHAFENDWRLSSKVKAAKYDHWFNLFLDGDGSHNTPEAQADYLADRGLPADASFTYVDNGTAMDSKDLLFENRVLDRERPMEEMVGEINLTKTIGNHNFTIGTFLSNTVAEDNNWIWNFVGDFSNSPRMVSIAYTDSLGNDVVYSPGGFIDGRQTSNKVLQSIKTAVYVADEFKGEKFNFDIGLRWEKASGILSAETGIGSNTFNKGNVSASDFAVALAGLYKMNENANLYANASKGYFFPELRGVKFSSPGSPQTYETEGILQGEVGIKYAKKKFSATGALFFVGLSDRRSVDFINDPNNPGNVIEEISVQSTRTLGVEANLNYIITKGISLYGNATFQDHEFTEVEGNPDQVGNELRRQPNFMGLVGISLERGAFDFDASSNFLGSKFANDANTVELEGFNIVRLDAGYTLDLGKKQSLRLGVSVFNLLDAAGVTEGSPRQGNTQIGGGEYFVGRPILPRRIFVRAAFDF
ncbi:MAG: TonB-dependent receptor [Bacteroidetes bacterium]|nr:MAG: TonB-dependent receptor [Bacteroidota bacterium]